MRQVCAVIVAFGLAAVTLGAQQGGGWTVPRTPDGHPDLQGVWANNGITPMTRPTQWKDKGPYLTPAELDDLKATISKYVDQGGDAIFGNLVQLALNAKSTASTDTGWRCLASSACLSAANVAPLPACTSRGSILSTPRDGYLPCSAWTAAFTLIASAAYFGSTIEAGIVQVSTSGGPFQRT